MSDAFTKKNVELSLEFDHHLVKHPELFEEIPSGAYVVITVSDDDAFNEHSVALIRDIRRKQVVEAHKSASKWSIKPLQLQVA